MRRVKSCHPFTEDRTQTSIHGKSVDVNLRKASHPPGSDQPDIAGMAVIFVPGSSSRHSNVKQLKHRLELTLTNKTTGSLTPQKTAPNGLANSRILTFFVLLFISSKYVNLL